MRKKMAFLTIAMAGLLLLAGQAGAVDFTVTITNSTNGSYFTPLLITAHDETADLFELGEPASAQLRAMAEVGDISGLSAAVGGADTDTVENPAGGLLAPGASVSADLNTDATGNALLSLVAMILPTNDGFVGIDSLMIPAASGTYVYDLSAYDAGTEANNEVLVPGSGSPGILGVPADPGGDSGSGATGVTATENNMTVHIHRGILGDANPAGGPSDMDSSIHRWLNPVARLTIEVW